MIRNGNRELNKYKPSVKNESTNRNVDDNMLLGDYRPLSDKFIKTIDSNKVNDFVDSLMTNRNLNQVLYTTNHKLETSRYVKSNKVFEMNGVHQKKKPNSTIQGDFIKNRQRREAIAQIKGEVQAFKTERTEQANKLQEDCKDFYQKIKGNKVQEILAYYKPLNDMKYENITRSFNFIKNKLDLSYKMKSRNSVLPEIKLDMNNVYSRLYHNAVFLSTNSNLNKTEMKFEDISPVDNNQSTKKNKTKFKVKNVIEATNGKEFTIKIDEEIFLKCLLKHSGGPSVELSRVIILC